MRVRVTNLPSFNADAHAGSVSVGAAREQGTER